MDDFLRVLIFLILTALTLPALLVTTNYLLPNRTEAISQILQTRPRRAFIVGGINALFFGLLAAVFSSGGDGGGLIALLLVLLLMGFSTVGLSATVLLLHRRMSIKEWQDIPLKTAVLLTLALLTPFIGWFIFAPIVGIITLGGSIMSQFQRKPKTQPDEAQLPF